LVISPSAAPGQDYHIAYTFPGGESATDMCKATSSTSFQCQTGETVTRDDNQHLVKLNDRGTAYVFYDPKHMPPTSSIFGRWSYHYKYGNSITDYVITIARGTNDKEYSINTAEHSNDGSSECYTTDFDRYQVTNNPDGTQTVSSGTGRWAHQFKLDPQKMQITSVNPNEYFYVGVCINISPEQAVPVFTKD